MKHRRVLPKLLRALSHFFVFFLLVAFVTSCCIMLFVTTMSETMGLQFTEDDIGDAAKFTMLNAILISVGFTIVDYLRRRWTVERPVKKITEATERIIGGDFSVRIEQVPSFGCDGEFRRIIEGINKMAEELGGMETLRTDFVANVSHEMKTPLSVIHNYGTLLQSPDLDDKTRMEYAAAVTQAARRLSDMMTNVLKLNRLEHQQIYPNLQAYDLGEQLCESLLQYETVWESRGIEIETDLAEDVTVVADPELLNLVWNNLLSNAFKFTERGGRVTVSLQATVHHAVVRVSDTGCGISPDIGEHIFEKFYQGDTSRATEGNGLGLALVKRVVDILGGEIGVESTLGKGSSFTVKIRRV